jgi:hypothetical protein
VHGFLAETQVIVDLLSNGNVAVANRKDVVRPSDAKRSDVRKILTDAALNFEVLATLWEGIHGGA